jgi:hypothetical protein
MVFSPIDMVTNVMTFIPLGLHASLFLMERAKVSWNLFWKLGLPSSPVIVPTVASTCIANLHPYFVAPTPNEGTTFVVGVGKTLEISVSAMDDNVNQQVTVEFSVLPTVKHYHIFENN